MAAVTDVTITAGVPTAGTGTVSTLDKFDGAVGTPTSRAITVQGNSSGTAIPVSLASVPSHAVTNAGTFAVQAAQSGTWTVQPGNTANTTAWLTKIGDGTNTAAIKAASTAPVAADPALVVTMSPNSQNANGQATMANSTPVVIASDDPVAVSLALIDDAIKADDAAFTPATTKVMMAGFQADEASTDSVDEGDAGAARMTLDRKVIVTNQPHTNGGLSIFRSLDLDETEEDVKTSAGCLYKLRLTNRTTSARYVKLYNATAANVTVGTTTPVDTIVVPGGTSADLCTVVTENFGGYGLTFDTALSMAATTGLADNDTGAPGANDVVATAYYK